jgi:AraC-like DNA-binding protein
LQRGVASRHPGFRRSAIADDDMAPRTKRFEALDELAVIDLVNRGMNRAAAPVRFGQICQDLVPHVARQMIDRLINDVAFTSGFKSAAHFCRMFKSAYGCTPREYRETFLSPST